MREGNGKMFASLVEGFRFLYTLLISNICFNLIYIHLETDMSPKWNDLTAVATVCGEE